MRDDPNFKMFREEGGPNCLPTDQIFTYNHPDTDQQYHFNASLLNRIRAAKPSLFVPYPMKITEEIYNLVMEHRGIEEPHLANVNINEPGLAVAFGDVTNDMDPKHFWENIAKLVLIDGNHRLVKRYRQGLREMTVWLTLKPVWEQCCMTPNDAECAEFMKGLVPK